MTGLSLGATALSAVQQAKAAKEEARNTADAARWRQQALEQNASTESSRLRRRARRIIDSQINQGLGVGGFLMEGSPMDALILNATELELEAQNVEVAARNGLSLEEGRRNAALAAGKQKAGAALLSGGVQAFGKVASLSMSMQTPQAHS